MSVSSSFYSVYTETESGEITPQSHIPSKWQSQGLKLNLSDCITPRQEKEDPPPEAECQNCGSKREASPIP